MQDVQLERGWLAEDILPPFYLENVFKQILNKGHKILHSEWYYQHGTVQPMWESHTELTYQVNIPALSKEKYLFFFFILGWGTLEWGIYMLSNRTRGNNRTTGSSHFEPDSECCMSAHPQVCRPLKEWLYDMCDVELIAQHDKPTCLVWS